MIEALVSPVSAEKRPWQMFLLGLLYSSLGIMLALSFFHGYSSLVMVFFTVFASVPIIYNTIKLEEQKDELFDSGKPLISEHIKALKVFMYLFFGFVFSWSVWYICLSYYGNGLSQQAFEAQLSTLTSINPVTGKSIMFDYFTRVFFNNLKVMVFCIAFSFVYGIGAIFILTWNASVIAAAIGSYIALKLPNTTSVAGFLKLSGCGFLFRYSLHGILEILAYFIAGLAGGIISVAVIRHRLGTKKFHAVLYDSADLIVAAVFILLIAGIIEAYLTPAIVSSLLCS